MHEIEEYKPTPEKDKIFKEVPVSVAISVTLFFYRLGLELSKDTLASLEMEMKSQKIEKKTSQAEDNSPRSGATTQASTQLLRETLQDLIRLQQADYLNVSPILHSKKKRKK